jgi:DNA-binding sugar fermentation-stimulating protein
MQSKIQQISRAQAEKYFEGCQILNSRVDQSADKLRISLSLSDAQSILVVYDTKVHSKSFFIEAGNKGMD